MTTSAWMQKMAMEEENGFRPIGSLLPKTESSRPGSGLTAGKSAKSSETSGSPKLASALVKFPGHEHTAIAAASLPRIEAAVRTGKTAEIMTVLRSSLEPFVEYSWRGIATNDPLTTCVEQRFEIRLKVDRDSYPAIRRMLEPTLLPAPHRDVILALTRLRALTISRSADETEISLVLSAFAEELAEFPADAALGALREWPKTHKFWPTLAEILELARESSKDRLAIAYEVGL